MPQPYAFSAHKFGSKYNKVKHLKRLVPRSVGGEHEVMYKHFGTLFRRDNLLVPRRRGGNCEMNFRDLS